MKWDALEEEPCSVARTIGVIGDRWTLLILRECFLRTRRFEGFQSALGITRHLLAERLKKLVRMGILRRIPYQESPKRHEYILTQKGLDLYPRRTAFGKGSHHPSRPRRASRFGEASRRARRQAEIANARGVVRRLKQDEIRLNRRAGKFVTSPRLRGEVEIRKANFG
jgi:DNA-binding HxlR family transcriptional regulator